MSKTVKSLSCRWSLFAACITLGTVSLLLSGCFFESISGTATPSPVVSVSPAQSSDTALVSTDVKVIFRNDMDDTTIASAFSLTMGGAPLAATVNYEAASKTATLIPDTDLLSNTEYRATISPSIKDIDGNTPFTTDYIWSFSTSSAMLLASKNVNGVSSNDTSTTSDIDASGRYIVFESEANNLTSVATTLNRRHIYRKDTISGEVILASSDDTGLVEANNVASNPGISSNGRYVIFESAATNLDSNIISNGKSQIFLKDLDSRSIKLVSRRADLSPDNGASGATNARVSDDGRYIVFQSSDASLSPINGNGIMQIYLKDMSDESVTMVSRNASNLAGNAASANAEMSADGRHIVFESTATNFTSSNGFNNIYYVDTSATTHAVELVSLTTTDTEPTANSNKPSVSDDGSMVVFHTAAALDATLDSNNVADVYLRDRTTPLTKLISVNLTADNGGNNVSNNARISGNAAYVAFESLASNLVTGDTQGVKDIFVRDLTTSPAINIDRVNIPTSVAEANTSSSQPAISSDGRYLSFQSTFKFTVDDTDTLSDIFRAHNSTHP